MNNQIQNWSNQYNLTKENPIYPTEWCIRTIAGANYPNLKLDKNHYKGKKILDISCGDGRNLSLLINLGFEVYATEISQNTIDLLSKRFPEVKFSVGFNHKQPFPDSFFDFVLACGSFYYLEDGTHFEDNVFELNRILKTDALFFANMTTKDTYLLDQAIPEENGEYLITNDPHNFRNGSRWQIVNSKEEIINLFQPYLSIYACSKMHDDYFGYIISNFIIVCSNIK